MKNNELILVSYSGEKYTNDDNGFKKAFLINDYNVINIDNEKLLSHYCLNEILDIITITLEKSDYFVHTGIWNSKLKEYLSISDLNLILNEDKDILFKPLSFVFYYFDEFKVNKDLNNYLKENFFTSDFKFVFFPKVEYLDCYDGFKKSLSLNDFETFNIINTKNFSYKSMKDMIDSIFFLDESEKIYLNIGIYDFVKEKYISCENMEHLVSKGLLPYWDNLEDGFDYYLSL